MSVEVFALYRIPTYYESSYKPFVISAMMFLTRLRNPGDKLKQIVNARRSWASRRAPVSP